MNVKYTDLNKRFDSVHTEYHDALQSILDSGQFIQGSFVEEFEDKVAKYLGVKYVVGVGSGTDALFLMMKYHKFKEGSEIITVPNSYLASVSTIFLNNLKPVYSEIDPTTLQIDVDSVERLISDKTVGIMAVHLMGSPCNIAKLKELCERYNLVLFEDFSQSFGAKYNNQYVGTFGTAGACSMHPLKNLPCLGDGGFVCTNSIDLYNWLAMARTHGHPHRDDCNFWSFNMRLDALQAKFAAINLQNMDRVLKKRQHLASIYANNLSNCKEITVLSYGRNHFHTYHTFVILANRRDDLKQYLAESGVEAVIHYPKLIPELTAHEKIKLSDRTKKLNSQVLSLPISEEHTKDDVSNVCKTIFNFYTELG